MLKKKIGKINETKKKIEKSNEIKVWFLKRETNLTNLWLDSPKIKIERTQINKTINERDVTTYTTKIQRIVRDYYEQLTIHQQIAQPICLF